ncbi:polysaccharide biosynthesis/export family protein [Wenzhouxiangellaceae bacterium CH-27]|uniref:Polysaccharide biosynthesis/export family protein n=1 Tax=Elongatibacter sediminis TaxID=3119006 RepID=A0AAW9RH96_9GAMM
MLLTLCSLAAAAQEPQAEPLLQSGLSNDSYALSPGDRLRISVFNHEDLSGEFQLDSDGRFSMPLIGTVDAAGLTPAELESLLVNRYKPDYLVNPRIFIQVLNARLYYLVGEVRGTGAFPYVPGMTYLTAIAKAGGFTYRAKKEYVYVVRAEDPDQEEIRLSVEELVRPGDIVRIAERLF